VDSSGAAEVIAATLTNKLGHGTRMFVNECCMGALDPWAFNIDAPSAHAGVEMGRVSDRMRYVAARYAILRYSEEVTADIKLRKCTSAEKNGQRLYQAAHRPRAPPVASANARPRRPPGAGLSRPPPQTSVAISASIVAAGTSPFPIALHHEGLSDNINRGLYHYERPQPSREAYLSAHA
jgi:hypothetical protein